jgi:SAM-dependent methyltransferase
VDDITARVRAMYEAFPYPPSAEPTLRVGSNARLLLSMGRLRRDVERPLTVLDAGCGRGAGVLGAAGTQPDVTFVGADVNRVALEEAREQAARRGLSNVRFVEVDLMTLDGLDVPAGGFDVITSSGVLHHLSDPAAGLARLRGALAPHGMLSLMVYGRAGREALYRTVRALDTLIPREESLAARLEVMRALAHDGPRDAMFTGPFADAPRMPDAELVDRYMHAHETSYDVRELFALLRDAGLKALRWNEPERWDVGTLLPRGPLRDRAMALALDERYALVEEMTHRPTLDLVACCANNGPRAPATRDQVDDLQLEVSPEVSFVVETRLLAGELRTESVVIRRRRATLEVPKGPVGMGALIARDQTGAFTGRELVDALRRFGVEGDEARAAVLDLIAAEVLFAP